MAAAKHHAGCEEAKELSCKCHCRGMLHQNSILEAAISSAPFGGGFCATLTDVFGSEFSHLSTPPSSVQQARKGRGWDPLASSAKQKTQVEQRIVDVTLHDLLEITHSLHTTGKRGWLNLLNDLTDKSYQSLKTGMPSHGSSNSSDGHFWASILAMVSAAFPTSGSLSSLNNSTHQHVLSRLNLSFGSSYPYYPYSLICFPRGRSGRNLKQIPAMTSQSLVNDAIDAVLNAWRSSNNIRSAGDKMFVLCLTGAAVSADLWRHPSAVNHLLKRAVELARNRYAASFSLDGPSGNVEDIIDIYLGNEWQSTDVKSNGVHLGHPWV